jgi:putative tryptophan/tyrosine transport system substrate-binding protein
MTFLPKQKRLSAKTGEIVILFIRKSWIALIITSFLASMTFAACSHHKRIFTIGIISDVSSLSPVLEGFKAGIVQLGYIEGKDVKYLVSDMDGNKKELTAEIRKLLAKKIDLLLTIGNQSALAAKEVVKGTGIPILAASCRRPVESGLVESITCPGGNITGVMLANSAPKTLEWMKTVIPGLKKIYVPYNPDDEPSRASLIGIEEVASTLGVEIVYHKIHSAEEAIRAVDNLPEDIQAVFRVPSPTLDLRIGELSNAAFKKGIPVGAMYPLDKDALIIFSADFHEVGKQASRLAYQIRQGVAPSTIPIESSEVYLTVNLKIAAKIGLTISDEVLIQAKTVIR